MDLKDGFCKSNYMFCATAGCRICPRFHALLLTGAERKRGPTETERLYKPKHYLNTNIILTQKLYKPKYYSCTSKVKLTIDQLHSQPICLFTIVSKMFPTLVSPFRICARISTMFSSVSFVHLNHFSLYTSGCQTICIVRLLKVFSSSYIRIVL